MILRPSLAAPDYLRPCKSLVLSKPNDEISKLINLIELEIYLTEKDILEDEEIDYVINELDQERAVEHVLSRVREQGNDG